MPATIPSPADRALTWGAVLVATACLAWIQLSFAGLYDLDSYFHVRAAQQLRAVGIEKTLPQATFSTWALAYSDKDFLFHVLLLPFVEGFGLVQGGKAAVVFCDLLVFAAFAYALHACRIRFGALWIAFLLAVSPYYLTRLASVRPHILGLAFLTLEIGLLFRSRWKTLFVVSALHVVAHSSFVLVPALLVARAAQCLVSREPQPLRPALAILLGIVVASLAHPYFPNNLTVAYDQIVAVARNVWFESAAIPREAFGSELRPMTWSSFLAQLPGWLPALAGLVAVLLVRGLRGWSPAEVYLGFVAIGMLLLATRSRRFVDLFVVSALLLAGALWTRVTGRLPLPALLRRRPLVAWPCALALAVLLVGGTVRSAGVIDGFARQSYGDIFRPAVAALDRLAAPEDVVYHSSWMDFAVLYGFRPRGRYISGLDPIFLYQRDPELFAGNLALSRGRARQAAQVLVHDFGARWIFVTRQPRDQAFRKMLGRLPRLVELAYADPAAEIWHVRVPPPPRAGAAAGDAAAP